MLPSETLRATYARLGAPRANLSATSTIELLHPEFAGEPPCEACADCMCCAMCLGCDTCSGCDACGELARQDEAEAAIEGYLAWRRERGRF